MKRDRKPRRTRSTNEIDRTLRIEEKLIKVNRVSKAIKGGRKVSFRAIVVAGNQLGKIGVGIGKASEVSEAIKKAKRQARKQLIEVPLTRSASVPHTVKGEFGAAKVLVMPAAEGTGVIAGGAIRTVLELVGLKNALAKQIGSSNTLNNVRAVMDAFKKLKSTTYYANLRDISINDLTARVPKSRHVIKEEKTKKV